MLMRLYDNFNQLVPFKPADLNRHLAGVLESLQEGMNRYLTGYPKMNVEDNDDNVVVKLSMPGVKLEDITVEVVSDFLTVKSTRVREDEGNGEDCLYSERRFSRFEEKIKLPAKVNGAETEAKYVNGVLIITMPKDEVEKPVSVKVC